MNMEDDIALPNLRRTATARVRRRVYVAIIMSLAIFLVGLLYWPLTARQFRTFAEITVQLPAARPTGAVLQAEPVDRDQRLQGILRECLSDAVLADMIRQATFQDTGGVARTQLADVRQRLSVGITRDPEVSSSTRWIQVIWTGPAESGARRLVDSLTQEIASRVARDVRFDALQRKLEERVDQIARRQTDQAQQLGLIVQQARQQIEQQQFTVLALRQQVGTLRVGTPAMTASVQRQVEAIKQQVLNSDAHLLSLLRQQVMHHFEVDETDGLVQHIERLIQDRQAVLAQVNQLPQQIAARSTVADLPPLDSTGSVTPVNAGSQSAAATPTSDSGVVDNRVRTNPFFTASAQIRREEENQTQLAEVREVVSQLQLDSVMDELQQLESMLAHAAAQRVPLLDVSQQVQQLAPTYRIVQVQPAAVSAPQDLAPTRQWTFGLMLIAVMVGTAFTLQHSPESLTRTLFRPQQLAQYLGIDHIGTIRTAAPQPNVVDRFVKLIGRRLFQAAELMVAFCLGGVIMAMIWEPTLPGLLVLNPLEGLCHAFWVLLGR
jgi:hypothetical protein